MRRLEKLSQPAGIKPFVLAAPAAPQGTLSRILA